MTNRDRKDAGIAKHAFSDGTRVPAAHTRTIQPQYHQRAARPRQTAHGIAVNLPRVDPKLVPQKLPGLTGKLRLSLNPASAVRKKRTNVNIASKTKDRGCKHDAQPYMGNLFLPAKQRAACN